MSKKDSIISVYRNIRNRKRACLSEKTNKENRIARDTIEKKYQKQVSVLQTKINELCSKKYKELNELKVNSTDFYGCPANLSVELQKFDAETDKKILDYLNGITETLID